eukprot:TRINITY_DN29551_c0_g1_i1.p1 TRINITY_DN29551_c0_g1~~TRINITY_DN29551_c0_g1_i1.p1  ORF type:complete len:651 (-),score=165.62 TRINITY_DN29551_c0_g1_i1:38-1990(-)
MLVDQRFASIQADGAQMASVNEYTASIESELHGTEGRPDKALMRELVAKSLQRALDLAGDAARRKFLEALTANIHKFPLQEQQQLARVYPVEISSEYRNLQSFVQEDEAPLLALDAPAGMQAVPMATVDGVAPPAALLRSGGASQTTLEDVRKRLSALTAKAADGIDEVLAMLLGHEVAICLQSANPKAKSDFFADLRLSLFKFPETSQRQLVEKYLELRWEVSRLVDSMTSEISRWLDEERAIPPAGDRSPLLTKMKALFQATLSPPFLANFKHLSAAEKRIKEAFLLKIALCLRTCETKAIVAGTPLEDSASRLRRQFFYVENYGELMEQWLNSRVKQFNEDFFQKVVNLTGMSTTTVMAILRRNFRPGRWLSLSDQQLEDDVYQLFLDEKFPRHVLSSSSIARMLKRVSAVTGEVFHTYGTIARLPSSTQNYSGSPPQSAAEATLLNLLQQFPPFPPMRRVVPGRLRFGKLEVDFVLAPGLMARPSRDGLPLPELAAEEFFSMYGPQEFPEAESMAISLSLSPQGAPTTAIDDGSLSQQAALPAPPVPGHPPMGMSATAPAMFGHGVPLTQAALPPPPALPGQHAFPPPPPLPGLPGASTLVRGPAPRPAGNARYEPYPTMPLPGPPQMQFQGALAPATFGLADDEI